MRNEFQNWMKQNEGKSENTSYQYTRSIDKISKHYSEKTEKRIDLYRDFNQLNVKGICSEYGIGGKYSDFGNIGNGTIRNAISTFVRFLNNKNVGNEELINYIEVDEIESENIEDSITSRSNNFTYERDLKNSLVMQSQQLFPGYVIYGADREGVEYLIDGKKIDLLLERKGDNSLLAVELKSGEADFRVFGQISMYLGLLSKRFPDKNIKGLIIAGEINETLINACLITDRVSLKVYRMQLTLEDIN